MPEWWPSRIAVSPRVELSEAQLETFWAWWIPKLVAKWKKPIHSLCVPIFAFPFSMQRALFSPVVWVTENMNSGFTQPDWKSCVTLKKTERAQRLKNNLQPCYCPSSHDKVTQRNDRHYLYGVGNIIWCLWVSVAHLWSGSDGNTYRRLSAKAITEYKRHMRSLVQSSSADTKLLGTIPRQLGKVSALVRIL